MLEITTPAGDFQYRQRPSDPRIVESRRNKRAARWLPISRHDSAEAARTALLEIEAGWRRKAAQDDSDGLA